MMRKRYLAIVIAAIVATPVLMNHQPVSAAAAFNCIGFHTWNLPGNSVGQVSGTMSEGWDRSCTSVDTSTGVFGWVTVNHDVAAPVATSSWSGNCLLSTSAGVDNGERVFVGPVAVGTGVSGTAEASSAGLLGTPSTIPCTGGTITWNGVEDFQGEP
jgi:hypothetical protein